jgi:hypothetical protein
MGKTSDTVLTFDNFVIRITKNANPYYVAMLHKALENKIKRG